jgi:hypothetical protein
LSVTFNLRNVIEKTREEAKKAGLGFASSATGIGCIARIKGKAIQFNELLVQVSKFE